jgi:hypothetical protein
MAVAHRGGRRLGGGHIVQFVVVLLLLSAAGALLILHMEPAGIGLMLLGGVLAFLRPPA